MMRLITIPIVLVVLLIGAMVWSGGGVEERADFAFINRGDIHTLDLNTMSYMQDFRLTYGIREGLYAPESKTWRPAPAVAEGVKLSDDRKTYTFLLRKAAKWSNGDPVTAHDFVFSWRHFLTQPGDYSYLFDYIKGARPFSSAFVKGEMLDWGTVGIEAPDDHTLRVTLNNPVPYFLDVVAFPPFYPRHERSMAKFRQFVDYDVMGPFAEHVAGTGRQSDGSSSSSSSSSSSADALRGFDIERATEAELLDKLAVFAALDVLPSVASESATGSAFDRLSPKDKLARMLEQRFVRFFFDKKYTRPPHVVTNGAFNLKEWDFARRLRLERSETYWDRANTKSKTIEMVVAENPQSQLLMYETGVVDWHADLPGDQAAELRKDGRGDVRTADAFGTNFLTLVCSPNVAPSLGGGPNPLADVRVRQALAMSVNKRYIVETVTRMGELPARTYMPPDGTLAEFTWKPGPRDEGRTAPYTFEELKQRLRSDDGLTGPGPGLPYDPEAARRLLAEAGYPNGQGFPRHPILYNTGNPTRRQIAQVVQEQWRRELGIDLPLQGVEGKIFQPRVTDKDYFIATVAWYGDYPDVTTFTDKYKSTSLQNDSNWKNPAFDELCNRAEATLDDPRRIELLSQAAHLIDTEAPIIPLYHYVNITMSRDAVHGVRPNPRNMTVFKEIWVERK